MLIQELNHIETAEDNAIQGGQTGSNAFVTVVGTGPSAATLGATTAGLSLDVLSFIPPVFSFDVGFATANAAGFGLFGFGGQASSTTVTL